MKTVLAVAMMFVASLALAADPVVYTGCISTSNGTLYSVHDGTTPMQPCKDKDLQISWNMAGVQGPKGNDGPQGAMGYPGAQGVPGQIGPQGPSGQDCLAGNVPAVQVIGRLLMPAAGNLGAISSDIVGVGAGAQLAVSTGGGGGATGKAEVSPITVVKKLDSNSPGLFYRLVSGLVSTTAEVLIFRAGTPPNPPGDPHDFAEFAYKLKNSIVTSLDTSTSDPGITEKVGLTFQEVCFVYYPEGGTPSESCFSLNPAT
jgi:type VI protein secretion system component Hcp